MKGDIQRIFQQYGDDYIDRNRDRLTIQQQKVIHCIQTCGTPAAGWIQFECPECRTKQYRERSCGNRMCPSCQTAKTADWLDKRLAQQLPTHYFLITFTVPEELNPFFLYKPPGSIHCLLQGIFRGIEETRGQPEIPRR